MLNIQKIKLLIISFSTFLIITSCSSMLVKQGPFTLEEVERERQLLKTGKRKPVKTLIDIYKDKNQPYDVRIAAIRALSDSQHPEVISSVQESIEDASLMEMDIMLEAIQLLISYQDEESTKALTASLKSTEMKVMEIREAIINAIGQNGASDEIYTLLELYEVSKSSHARMNKLLTLTLGSIGDDRAIPMLIDIARDTDIDIHIRNRAVEILSRKESPELVDFFIEMIGEPSTRDKVNEYALNVMGDLQNEKMVMVLLESYQTSRHQYYALMNSLLNSLGNFQNPAIKPIFIEIASTEELPKALRLKAIRSLSKFNDPDVADGMVKILESPANYIYYNEIITLLKELKVYGKYKNQLRLSAYKAMQKNNENEN